MDRAWLLLRWLNFPPQSATTEDFTGTHIGKGAFTEARLLKNGMVLRTWFRSSRSQILRELDLLTKLPENPHICQIQDVSPGGCIFPFYGESLQKILEREQSLPLADAVDFMGQCAVGLEALHEKGIIHADLTPANMCLLKKHLTIIDFGKSLVEGAMPSFQADQVRSHLTTP